MNATPPSNVTTKRVLKGLYHEVTKYPFTALIILFGVAASSAFDVIAPIFYKRFFDLFTVTPAEGTFKVALSILATIFIIKGLSWLFLRIAFIPNAAFDARIMANLTNKAFSKLMRHSPMFFSNSFSGALVRKIGRLDRTFETIWQNLIQICVPIVVSMTGIILVVYWRSPLIALIFGVWMVFFVYANYVIFRWKFKHDIKRSLADTKLTGALSDAITNSTNVQLFSGFSFEEKFVGQAVDLLRRLRRYGWTINDIIRAIQGVLGILIEVGVMLAAFHFYQKGTLTLGDFFLFQAYIVTLTNHAWSLGWMMRAVFEAIADAKEAFEIIDKPYDVQDVPGAKDLIVTRGEIEFKDVVFNFNETRTVLDGFNLSIGDGEKIAFVGSSGAGKTTLTKLLFRFYDVTGGMITIDGQDISKVTQESLRNAIALVPQEPILFHRTLKENIAYGRRDATDEEIIAAAKKAHCHEFISELSDGYDTLVGERGVKLSGGERQRVAIARAILKNAPILVLDEATSSLDSESEHLIQDALKTLMEGKTVIVIAHRLSTINTMDRIVVVEDGKVRATGTHSELLTHDDVYKKFWDIQAGGFIGEGE